MIHNYQPEAIKRKIKGFGDCIIDARGVRLDDFVTIMPIHGQRRRVKLKRTEILMVADDHSFLHIEGTRFTFPAKSAEDFSYSLRLCPTENCSTTGKSYDQKARYLLRSNCSKPFKINGVLSFESFVERGDIIDIEYNRLHFLSGDREEPEGDKLERVINVDNCVLTDKIVTSDIPILIEGETGTGKSRLAKIIHQKSGRMGDFVHVNLTSFAVNLIESELFGHIKGAFTGANFSKRGAFIEASGGTLFLDEIDSLPIGIQTKLLLFLDSKHVRQVGGEKNIKSDVRFIFASGKKLKDLVLQKEIRPDFYYRISSGITCFLKPLRECLPLIESLLNEFSQKNKIYIPRDLQLFYKSVKWQGNIRQLLGHLEKKLIIGVGRKFEFDQSDELLSNDCQNFEEVMTTPPFMMLDEVKIQYAWKTFLHFDSNIKKSAQVLGISNNTLRSLIRKVKCP